MERRPAYYKWKNQWLKNVITAENGWHQCWWPMFGTVWVGDNCGMLVTDSSQIKIHQHINSATNIFKIPPSWNCHHRKFTNTTLSPTSLWPYPGLRLTQMSILVEIVIWYCIFKWSDCLILLIVFPRSIDEPVPPGVRCDWPLCRIEPFAKLS